tara:strand:+ start:207 stop:425 length:219 start_codon:yes stop_codon:yes gene_type:complete
LTDKWKPTQEQQLGAISRTFDSFTNQLTELQDELYCPDEFIYDFLEVIRNCWSEESCHTKMRKLKKIDPDAF